MRPELCDVCKRETTYGGCGSHGECFRVRNAYDSALADVRKLLPAWSLESCSSDVLLESLGAIRKLCAPPSEQSSAGGEEL